MNKRRNFFGTNVRVLIALICLGYIFYVYNSSEEREYVSDSYITTTKAQNIDLLNSFANTTHIDENLSVFANIDKNGARLEDQLNAFNKAINNNKYFCLSYKKSSEWFPQSQEARRILEENWPKIVELMKDKFFYESKWEFWLPKDIVIVKNSSMLWISGMEFEDIFEGKTLTRKELPKYLTSTKIFNTWRGEFLWTSFDLKAYGYAEFLDFTNAKNEKITTKPAEGQSMIYSMTKNKKKWNGLSIAEYNSKKFNEMKNYLELPEDKMTLNDWNTETESLKNKKTSYSAEWYYNSLEEYINLLKQSAPNHQIKETYISNNKVLLETEDDYIGLFFDNNNIFVDDYEDIKEKTAYINQNYTIRDIYYFIDKSQFTLSVIQEDEIKDCQLPVRNNIFLPNKK